MSIDEKEVRQTLDVIWKQPEEAQEILGRLREMNEDLYRFEKMLESRETTI